MTHKARASRAGFFNLRALLTLALCSCGVFLGILSLAATPSAAVATSPQAAVHSTNAAKADHYSPVTSSALPPGVPFPPNAQSSAGGNPGFARLPIGLEAPSVEPSFGLNSLGNPVSTSRQSAPSEGAPLASVATSDWSIVDSPNSPSLPADSVFYGVSCVSASDCWAVGYYEAGLGNPWHTLTEHWNGTSWTIVASPNTDPAQTNYLYSVICLSTSDCWAVGSYGDTYQGPSLQQTLIEHWDGTGWTIISSPNTSTMQNNALYGVTCVGPNDCWVVGYHYDYDRVNNQVGALQTLTEHWNGTSWTIVNSPNTSATQRNYLLSVTCASSSNCWAAGTYFNGSAQQTLIEHWDGTSWTIAASPNTGATIYNVLYGVTCSSANNCWAVGFYDGGVSVAFATIFQTLIEHWDGTSWTIVTSPNTLNTQSNQLVAVTCRSTTDCWAVGYYDIAIPTVPAPLYRTLIERWDGSSWTVVSSPNTDPTQTNYLLGVACAPRSADCVTVGYYYNGVDYPNMTEHWDGTAWAVVSSPNVYVPQRNYLTGVTCVSATDCWAVGYYYDGTNGHARTLIEHWNGTAWIVVSSPNTDAADGEHHTFLYGVTCSGPNDCWAVGRYAAVDADGVFINQTLIEHWDGTSWNIVPSANVSPVHDNVLNAVSCASASDCWAVGYSSTIAASPQTLIERWDGTSWTIVASPNTNSSYNSLSGVTCSGPNDCWAVGYAFAGAAYQTLIERWNGISWAIVPSSNTAPTQNNYLSGVTCASASQCWAVGSYNAIGTKPQTLIEGWNGTSWTIVSSANTSDTHDNVLNGTTCVGPNDCWAVGYAFANFAAQTLIEHWDGTAWTIVNSPNTDDVVEEKNFLDAVACVPGAANCWAVGYSGVDLTLAEHYAVTLGPTSVVSRKVHGTSGTHDIDLANGGIECRSGGANGNYVLVFTFANPLSSVGGASITVGTGSAISANIDSSDAHNYVVTLTGVANAQRLTVALTDVTDTAGNFSPAVAGSMNVLIGDTNGDGVVNSADIGQTKSQSGNAVTVTNFREDLNADGSINSADIGLVKSKSGTTLP